MLNNKMAIGNCIRNNAVIIVRSENHQWISDGWDLYQLRGLPDMTPDQVLSMMGVAPKAVDKIYMDEDNMPEYYELYDLSNSDQEIELPEWTMKVGGTELWILKLGSKLWGIPVQSVKPTIDKNDDYVRYIKRGTDDKPYVCVMDGMEMIAIISPVKTERLADEMHRFAYSVMEVGF